jgi:acetoin utilization protein AcuB
MARHKNTPPVRQHPEVREYMTPAPFTVAPNRMLSEAVHVMRDKHVRHLPVLDGGRVVGVLSQRDVLIIESLPGVNPDEVQLEEAMVQDVFMVRPDTPVGEAIESMIDRKLGSAIVTEDDRVLGVFTTIDALRALHQLLEQRR